MNREEIQLKAIKAWVDKGRCGTIVLPTGTGKMKVAIDIIGRQLRSSKITNALVVVPTTNLIEQFKSEFDVWGFDYTHVTFMCIQSAYKLEDKYDLLVIDEIHTAIGPKYQKVFKTVKYDQILGLTATPPEEMEVISKYCPIVYHKNLKDILDAKIVSDFKILNIPIKFSRKEQAKYNRFNELFGSAQLQLNIARSADPKLKDTNVFDMAQKYSSLKIKEEDYEDISTFKEQERLIKFGKQYWSAMSMRKWVCYNSEQKANAAIEIVRMYPDRKWIIFNKSIKSAEYVLSQLGDKAVIYHSKMKPNDRQTALDKFSDNTFTYLVAVDALNAGLNVKDANSAICISGVSTELVAYQQIGQAA